MAGKGSYQVVNPPNKLAQKVPRSGGPHIDEIVKRAEAGLRELQEHNEAWIREDLARLEAAWKTASEASEDAPGTAGEIHAISHEIKGHGATFEYPLIGLVAESLCALIPEGGHPTARHLHLVHLHLDAMKLVINQNMTGDGGEKGLEMIAMLRAAVEKARGS
jgi:hypothetical protein